MKITANNPYVFTNTASQTYIHTNRISANIMRSVGLETEIMKSVRRMVDQVELNNLQRITQNYNKVDVETGDSDDTINASELVDSKLSSGKGDDKIRLSNVYNSYIDSGDGNDTVTIGNARNVTIDTGSGDDTVNIYQGKHSTINAGDGNDEVTIDNTKFLITRIRVLEPGEVVYVDRSPKSTVFGGAGDDKISILGENSYISGGSGNDTLRGHGVINGDEGDDTINGSGTVSGGSGNDVISGSGNVSGGTGNDIINASGVVNGDEGNDTITGAGIISGGTGNDMVTIKMGLNFGGYGGDASIVRYNRGDGHDIVNVENNDTILDMSSISKEEVDVVETFNGETGYRELSVTMKDGSGSITFISNNKHDELYANGIKVKHTLEEQGLIAVTPDKAVTYLPQSIQFSDGSMHFER